MAAEFYVSIDGLHLRYFYAANSMLAVKADASGNLVRSSMEIYFLSGGNVFSLMGDLMVGAFVQALLAVRRLAWLSEFVL